MPSQDAGSRRVRAGEGDSMRFPFRLGGTQQQHSSQASLRHVLESERAALSLRQRRHDGQAQPGAASATVA